MRPEIGEFGFERRRDGPHVRGRGGVAEAFVAGLIRNSQNGSLRHRGSAEREPPCGVFLPLRARVRGVMADQGGRAPLTFCSGAPYAALLRLRPRAGDAYYSVWRRRWQAEPG